jgi:signal transduction histidine kinase
MNTRSIRFRLIAWHAALLGGIFLLLAVSIYIGVKLHLEKNLSDIHVRWARQIGLSLVAKMGISGEAVVIDEIKGRFAPEANRRFIRVSRPDKSIMYVSGIPQDQSFDPSRVPLPRSLVSKPTTHKIPVSNGHTLLVVALPMDAIGGTYQVESGTPLDSVQDFLHQLLFWMALSLPVLVGLSVVGGHHLLNQALAPVEKTCRTAEQITLQNLSQRLPVTASGDELERLATALNLMIARLEDAFRHNRRFMADASHEMRTPLTVIRGELESLAQHPEAPQDIKSSLGNILEEAEALAGIVENLFAIARFDGGEVQAKWTNFDFAKLVVGTAEQMLLLAEDKQITITWDAATPVMVQGDSARMKQVVVNLLDNAIKYTQPGGSIQISVRGDERNAILEVVDNGMGIPLKDQPYIFERFYRVDKARTRELGGAGLGLAIVKSICAAHGGTVEVHSSEGHGSRFKVELPIIAVSSPESSKHLSQVPI